MLIIMKNEINVLKKKVENLSNNKHLKQPNLFTLIKVF